MTIAEDLRIWARGSYPLTAATELLIRADLADPGDPWVNVSDSGRATIDFDTIPGNIAALPGGQQRIARIACALVDFLGDNLAGLDYDQAQLAVTAISHATGYGDDFRALDVIDGKPRTVTKRGLGGFPS